MCQGSRNCGILQSQIWEHGESLENLENMENVENMEKMEKMENTNKMTWNLQFMIQNTLFVNHMTQNILFYSIYCDSWKIITWALGEHNPGSAQDGRTWSEM